MEEMKVCWRFPQTARFFQSIPCPWQHSIRPVLLWISVELGKISVEVKHSTAQNAVCYSSSKGTCRENNQMGHALMIGKESLKGWWILTTLKKWTGWAQALFRKVVGDRFYSSSVPKYIYFGKSRKSVTCQFVIVMILSDFVCSLKTRLAWVSLEV